MQNQFGEAPEQNRFVKYDTDADIPRQDGKLTQPQPAIPGGGPANQLADPNQPVGPALVQPQPQAISEPYISNENIPAMDLNAVPDVGVWASFPRWASDHYATDQAQMISILEGNTDNYSNVYANVKATGQTVETDLIRMMRESYNESFIDQFVLSPENLEGRSDEEKIRMITSEYVRLNADEHETRTLLAMNMLRQGLGSVPVDVLNRATLELTPAQARGLLDQYRNQQRREYERIFDSIGAEQGVGFTTGVALGEVILQDILPFWGAITRVIGTNKFLPHDVEISAWKRGLPGEVRQAIREWWVNASHQDRLLWLNEVQAAWAQIRQGENSKFFTRYMVIENLMGLATDPLLSEQDPTDTLDRVFGNLDTALGAVIAGGLFAKRGKSVFDLWLGGKDNAARQAATAAGARQAEEALDNSIAELVMQYGITPGDAAIPNLVRPLAMIEENGVEILTDTVKHTTTPDALRRQRILDYTNQADNTLITDKDKLNTVKRLLDEITDQDNVHVMHKMSSARGLENNAGIEFGIVYGSRTGQGWSDVVDLIDDMDALDPNLDYTILVRGASGKAEEVPVTPWEMRELKVNGRIPKGLEPFIEMSPDNVELMRFFGGRPISRVSMDELEGALRNDWIPADSPIWDVVNEELRARNARGAAAVMRDPMLSIDGDEFFVQVKKTHYWDHTDMQDLDVYKLYENLGKTNYFDLSWLPRWMIPPNSRFGRLYEAARRSYHMEEAALSELADIMRPFDKLNAKGKQAVNQIIEYVEDYAKGVQHETGVAKAPDAAHLRTQFPAFGDEIWEGYNAMREALDGTYDVLNRRLYRNLVNRGGVTIRSMVGDNLPNWHGTKVTKLEDGKVYDPVRQELVKLTKEEWDDIVDQGGGAIKLDFPIDAPSGGAFDVVLARPGQYETGPLSKRVLSYHEGYHFRFYEDPYYVVKREYNPTINGRKAKAGDIGVETDANGVPYIDRAVRTAGSHEDAFSYINRGKKRYADKGDGTYRRVDGKGPIWVIKPSKQLSNTEGSLYQTQALHQEGRMFWDERAMQRLPDVNGNRAQIADPTTAMQKGLAMAMRQTTQESLFKSIKAGFEKEFRNLPKFAENKNKLNSSGLDELEKDLRKGYGDSTGETRKQYKKALEIIRYMRTQLGTDSWAVPALRQATVNMAVTLERWLGRPSKLLGRVQKMGMSLDPFARARKIAYGAFMVLRPVRQLALQSAQISMLTGLAPTYIGSGRIFLDALALRRGLSRFRWAGFDDGWSDSKLASAMGLTKKEYKRVVEEFHRSGLMGSVNTHSFNAGSRGINSQLAGDAGTWGRFAYDTKVRGRKAYNFLAKGFELGEQNNLTFTYLVALRRMKKKYGVKDLTKFTRQQWDEVVSEADSLALAMTRPNKMTYQTGYIGTLTQFLSFQHRALLTMLGLNPKLSRADTAKMWAGMGVLWGGSTFGLDDYIKQMFAENDMSHLYEKKYGGFSIGDIISNGMIDAGFNAMAAAVSDDWQDLDLSTFAPGASVTDIYKNIYDLVSKEPALSAVWLGPASNPIQGFTKGLRFMYGDVFHNEYRTPAEKLMRSAEVFGTGILPGLNDANQSWIAYQHQEWQDADGDKLGIQPTVATLAARSLLGVRTDSEMGRYQMRTIHWDNQENIENWVKTWRPYLKQMARKWTDGHYNDEHIFEFVTTVHNLTESAPEGARKEIYERLMNEPDLEGESIAEMLADFFAKNTYDLKSVIPYVMADVSLSQQEKDWLINMINEVSEAQKIGDKVRRNADFQ